MTLGEFRRLTASLPDEADLDIYPEQEGLQAGPITLEIDEEENGLVILRTRIMLDSDEPSEIPERLKFLEAEINRAQEEWKDLFPDLNS